ncbi:MAG: hypothetical protein OXU51_20305 [Candidatus Poribacteria bacterium]|nr:hypothetical protein [Candidatus Poribacteria bacterium]
MRSSQANHKETIPNAIDPKTQRTAGHRYSQFAKAIRGTSLPIS